MIKFNYLLGGAIITMAIMHFIKGNIGAGFFALSVATFVMACAELASDK